MDCCISFGYGESAMNISLCMNTIAKRTLHFMSINCSVYHLVILQIYKHHHSWRKHNTQLTIINKSVQYYLVHFTTLLTLTKLMSANEQIMQMLLYMLPVHCKLQTAAKLIPYHHQNLNKTKHSTHCDTMFQHTNINSYTSLSSS